MNLDDFIRAVQEGRVHWICGICSRKRATHLSHGTHRCPRCAWKQQDSARRAAARKGG